MGAIKISANFAFLALEFPHVAEAATLAERSINADPRASCFHARHTLEQLVKRIYNLDRRFSSPRVTNLDGYLNEPTFRHVVGQRSGKRRNTSASAATTPYTAIVLPSRRQRWT